MTEIERPLVTFAVLAYNQEPYIREAVVAAFAQTYEPLEIIISDDCSQDSTFGIISELVRSYNGPHRVVVRRNETNLGLAEHISAVMRAVNGELIVVAAGDDISYPNRTQRIVEQWLANNKESGSIFSTIDTLSDDGQIVPPEKHSETLQYKLQDRHVEIVKTLCRGTLGCAQAWSRDVFQVFGALDRRLLHEDISIPLRSLMLGSVTFIQESLVLYRLNDGTLSRISYKNSRDRFLKMGKYWAGRVANFEQFDKDLGCALERRIVEIDDANWLRPIVEKERESAVLNYKFFTGDFLGRIRAITTASSNVSTLRKMKLMLIAFFPWLYYWQIRRS